MAFEVYKPRGERTTRRSLVTLSQNSIVLNKHAREKLNAEKVELAYDPESNTIRIKAADNGQIIKKTKVFRLTGRENTPLNIKKKRKLFTSTWIK